MVEITSTSGLQTVLLTYEVPFGTYDELLSTLVSAYDDFLSGQPGFVGAAIHVNEAKTRVASYSQWKTREDFFAVLRSETMQAVNRKLSDLSRGFEPVLYDVARVYPA